MQNSFKVKQITSNSNFIKVILKVSVNPPKKMKKMLLMSNGGKQINFGLGTSAVSC